MEKNIEGADQLFPSRKSIDIVGEYHRNTSQACEFQAWSSPTRGFLKR